MSTELHVGDMVLIGGARHMVLRLLDGGKVRVRQWPIIEAPMAFEVDAEGLEIVPPEHLGASGGSPASTREGACAPQGGTNE